MDNLINQDQFVQPYPQEALDGELGLTLHDVAKSLGAEFRDVKKKFVSRGFGERINLLEFKAVANAATNESNGLLVESFTLNVPAAKFFVGKYNSELGDAYLAYLIRLEQRVDSLNKLVEEDPLAKSLLHLLQVRETQLRMQKQIHEMDTEIKSLAKSVSDGTIDDRVEKLLEKKKIGIFPQGCLSLKSISKKFFRDVTPEKVKQFLFSINHARNKYTAVINGSYTADAVAFRVEGLDKAAEKFFSEATFVKSQKNGMKFHHPTIGNFLLS